MSQIASVYLVKDDQREELPDGGCSNDVYMAILDYCEAELDIDCRINAPQTEGTQDCALIDEKIAAELLEELQSRELSKLTAEIVLDWDLPAEVVQRGLETLLSHLEQVQGNAALLYEMT